jgi:uncharacterized protein YlxP (DUF503 family)
VALHVLALAVEVRIPDADSLKAKRSVVRSLVEGSKRRFGVSAAETGLADEHQRAELGFSVVSGSPGQCTEVLDAVERFVWSFPEIEVVGVDRHWTEVDR